MACREKSWEVLTPLARELLEAGVRVPVCEEYGILLDSDLHPCISNCRHFLGQLLVMDSSFYLQSLENSLKAFKVMKDLRESKLQSNEVFQLQLVT